MIYICFFFEYLLKEDLHSLDLLFISWNLVHKLYNLKPLGIFVFFQLNSMLLCNYTGPHYDHRKCYKNVHFLKTNHSHAHILSKQSPFSEKNIVLMSFFQKIFMINITLPCPCSVKKTSILSKLHYIMDPTSQ